MPAGIIMYNFNPEYTLNGVILNNENKKRLKLVIISKAGYFSSFFF